MWQTRFFWRTWLVGVNDFLSPEKATCESSRKAGRRESKVGHVSLLNTYKTVGLAGFSSYSLACHLSRKGCAYLLVSEWEADCPICEAYNPLNSYLSDNSAICRRIE